MSAPLPPPVAGSFELLGADPELPPRDPAVDRFLRALAEELVRPAPDGFDPARLAALEDGRLDDDEAAAAHGELLANPRKLQELVDLRAALAAWREDVGVDTSSMPALDFVPPPVAPVVDLAERRGQRRWLAVAAALAAALLLGLLFVIPQNTGLPGPLEARVVGADLDRTLRSGARFDVGDTLTVEATVDDATSWAVVGVAARSGPLPVRVWVASTSRLGDDSERGDDGRVLYRETVAAPAGRRAYVVVASSSPMIDLPALVTGWEKRLRQEGRRGEHFARDLQAIVDAEAGERAWRVSRAIPVEVSDLGL